MLHRKLGGDHGRLVGYAIVGDAPAAVQYSWWIMQRLTAALIALQTRQIPSLHQS